MSEDKISREAGFSMFTKHILSVMAAPDAPLTHWTARELADAVSRKVCGYPSVAAADLREAGHPDQVVYNAITKHFSRMLNPTEAHYFPPFQRSAGRYYLTYIDREMFDALPDVDWTPHRGSRNLDAAFKEKVRRAGDSRNTSLERRHLPKVLDATDWTCCGCGKQDIRPSLTLWQPDLIVPAAQGGWPVLGNIASTCFPCNFYKGARDYEYLWRHNVDHMSMWDERRARWALEQCFALVEQETE